jgi:soluble lytic murein transglycosylase-like protein
MKQLLITLASLLGIFSQANAFCFDEAGREFNVNPILLRAIAVVESNMQPGAINKSHVERTGTIDIGLMQINSGALPMLEKLGVTKSALLENPCLNVRVGAKILAAKYKREGPGWGAVGAYNAGCTQLKGDACINARNAYIAKVWRALNQIDKQAAARDFAGHAPMGLMAIGQIPKLVPTPKGPEVASRPQIASIASVEIGIAEIEKNIE